MDRVHSLSLVPTEGQPISNARLVAELQAVALAIRIGGLDRLPEVMAYSKATTANSVGTQRSEVSKDHPPAQMGEGA